MREPSLTYPLVLCSCSEGEPCAHTVRQRILHMPPIADIVGAYLNAVNRIKTSRLHGMAASTVNVLLIYISPKIVDLLP